VPSVPTLASHGQNGSLVMHEFQQRARWRSGCLASQRALPPRSVWRQFRQRGRIAF